MGHAVLEALEVHGVEGFMDAGLDFGGGEAELLGAEGDVFEDGGQKSWSEGSWKTMPTVWRMWRSWAGEALRVEVPRIEDFAGGVFGVGVTGEEAVEVEEEGGFAGTVGADEADGGVLGDGAGDAAEGVGVVGEMVVEVAEFEGGDGGRGGHVGKDKGERGNETGGIGKWEVGRKMRGLPLGGKG